VNHRRLVALSLLLVLTGLVVAVVGVNLTAGPEAGLIADGLLVSLVGVAAVVLWA
jgi:hypothetical protein